MPQVVSRRKKLQPKVSHKNAHYPPHQVSATLGYDSVFTIPQSPAPPTAALRQNNQIYFDLESYECDVIEDICFRFRITNNDTSEAIMVPVPWLFQRVVIEFQKGTGDEAMYIYPPNWVLWYWTIYSQEQRDHWAELSNFDIKEYKSQGKSQRMWDGLCTRIGPGETKEIYIPIPCPFLHMSSIDMRHIIADLRFRLELSSDIIAGGGTNLLELNDVHLIVSSTQEADFDKKERVSNARKNVNKYVYLDVERLTYNDKQLQSGSQTRYNLDQFVGKCAFLQFVILPSVAPNATDRSLYNFCEIGDFGTIDISNSAGRSIYGNGQPVREREIYQRFVQQTGNPYHRGMYTINFSDNMKRSFAGEVCGYHQFLGNNDYLEIIPGQPAVSHCTNLTLSAVPTQGFFLPGFERTDRQHTSGVPGHFGDEEAAILAQFNSLAQENKAYSVISVTGNWVDTSVTMCFDLKDGDVACELGNPVLLSKGMQDGSEVNIGVTSVTTTRGVRGWENGQYTLQIFMYKYKELIVEKNGRLYCRDL